MDADLATEYYDSIPALEAQELLLRMKIGDYPWMKQEKRKTFFDAMRRQAYPDEVRTPDGKVEDAVKFLRRKLNG